MSELSTDVQMTEPWPEPAKLPSGLPEVMSFNEDMLPASLRPWVNDIAERMQCPPDYIAATAMVVAGALVGRKIGIRPKQHDDWLVIPNLFGLIVGRPSLMKTPAMREVLNILTKFENQAREKYEADLAEHELVQDVRDIQKKAAREELRKQAKKSPDAEEEYKAKVREMNSIHAPVRQRYMTTNATVEKLGEILRDNPNGVLIHMDELIGFLRSMDRDGHECDRSFYLTAWDGCGRYTYDRIGRGTVEIEAAIVSIIGSIQPGVIASYVRGAVAGGTGDDGLIQRFQVMVWPDPPPGWSNVDRPPTQTPAKMRLRHLSDWIE